MNEPNAIIKDEAPQDLLEQLSKDGHTGSIMNVSEISAAQRTYCRHIRHIRTICVIRECALFDRNEMSVICQRRAACSSVTSRGRYLNVEAAGNDEELFAVRGCRAARVCHAIGRKEMYKIRSPCQPQQWSRPT